MDRDRDRDREVTPRTCSVRSIITEAYNELAEARNEMAALFEEENTRARAFAKLVFDKAVTMESELEEAVNVGVSRLADLERAKRESSLLRIQNDTLSARVEELEKEVRHWREAAAMDAACAATPESAALSAPTKRRRAAGDSVQNASTKNRKRMNAETDDGRAVRRSSPNVRVESEQRASQLVDGTARMGGDVVRCTAAGTSDAGTGDVALALRDLGSRRVERGRNDNAENDDDDDDFVDAKARPMMSRGEAGGRRRGGCENDNKDGTDTGKLVGRAAAEKENTRPQWRKYPKRERECRNLPDFDFRERGNSKIVTNRPIEDQRKRDTPPERWRLSQTSLD